MNCSNAELEAMLRDGKGRVSVVKELAQQELARRGGMDPTDGGDGLEAAVKALWKKEPQRFVNFIYPGMKAHVAHSLGYTTAVVAYTLKLSDEERHMLRFPPGYK